MRKIGLLFLWLVLFCMAEAQVNVDSLFQIVEAKSSKNRLAVSLELAQYFMKEDYCEHPSAIGMTDNKRYIEAIVYLGMANYAYEKGDFQKCLQCAQRALDVVPATVDSLLYFQEECYEVFGAAYFRLGQYDNALTYTEKQYKIAEKLNDNTAKSSALNSYAAIYYVSNRLDEAEKCAQRAIDIERKQNNDKSLAIRLGMMGEIKLKQNKPEEALTYIDESLEIDRKANRIDKVGVRLSQKADICMVKGDWKLCKTLLLEAKDIFKKTDNIVSYAITLKQLGRAEMSLNHPEEAEKYLLEGVDLCKKIGFKQVLQILYSELGELYRDKDPRSALIYFEKSERLKDTLHTEEQMQQLNEFQVRFKTQEKEHQLAMQQMKNKRKMYMIVVLVFFLVLAIIFLIETVYLSRIQKKRNEELVEMNETKNRFFSIVSHDLKNPVAAQKQMLDLLHANFNTIPASEMQECIRQLKFSNDAMARMLKDLMHWISLESGRIVYSPTRLNLKRLLEDVIRQQQAQAQNKNITISHNVLEDIYVTEDSNFMIFILRNLLSNAIKFSHPDGSVEIVFSQSEDKNHLSVVDHGVGMNPAQLEKLFKVRIVSTNGTCGEPGTGLGMLLCREMADKGGNQISVQSEEGKGTVFTISVKS